MNIPPAWSTEWWAFVAVCAVVAVVVLWLLASHSLLLQQIIWPPLIDGGHYQSKRWKTVRDTRLKQSRHGRCIICGCQGEKTWHLFSVQRRGWGWRIISLRSTARALQVHELVYAYTRHSGSVPKRYLWLMCPTHHAALHNLDKALMGWDRRNRLLWLTSLVYRSAWYGAYGVVLSAVVLVALLIWRPDVVHHIVSAR